jgi:hypothetical protein
MRLETQNPQQKKTAKAKVPLTVQTAVLVASMAGLLNVRMAFRLSIIMAGMMLADDRRVATAWFAAAGVQDDRESMAVHTVKTIRSADSRIFHQIAPMQLHIDRLRQSHP